MLQLTVMWMLQTVKDVASLTRKDVNAKAAVLMTLLVTGPRDASDQVSNSYLILSLHQHHISSKIHLHKLIKCQSTRRLQCEFAIKFKSGSFSLYIMSVEQNKCICSYYYKALE